MRKPDRVSSSVIEARLAQAVRTQAGIAGGPVTLLEAFDSLSESFDPLLHARELAATHPFADVVDRAPLATALVASLVGFAYEGVGTVFWARLEAAVATSISLADRRSLGDAFRELYARMPGQLVAPISSAFNDVFSIISWPIAHALMPRESAAAVSRLLTRAPAQALPAIGREADFGALRIWATAAEGQRLADWLRLEPVAERVLVALLSDNAAGRLPPATFERLREAFESDWAIYAAWGAGKARAATAAAPRRGADTRGQLSLMLADNTRALFVSWPPLPPEPWSTARKDAGVANWRPRLWGLAAIHHEEALSAGPIELALTEWPATDVAAYADAAEVFGTGSDVAAALAARTVDWARPMLFACDADDRADWVAAPLTGRTGRVWILPQASDGRTAVTTALETLRRRGTVAGVAVYEADLSREADRAILAAASLWRDRGTLLLARHPVDAARTEARQVTAGRPLAVWAEGDTSLANDAIVRLTRDSIVQAMPITVAPQPPAPAAAFRMTLLERETAYDALLDRRLTLQIASPWRLRDLDAVARLYVGGRIIACGHAKVAPGPIGCDHPLLAPLLRDSVQEALLGEGAGRLIITIGSIALDVPLARSRALVIWDPQGQPHLQNGVMGEVQQATATAPHIFRPQAVSGAARATVVRLPDRRLADPALIEAVPVIDLGEVSADFGAAEASRRMQDRGRGLQELAQARSAWARGECRTLAAVAARGRVVLELERPLVEGLCGPVWLGEERLGGAADYWGTLWDFASEAGLILSPVDLHDDDWAVFKQSFVLLAPQGQRGWPVADGLVDAGGLDATLEAAFGRTLAAAQTFGRLKDIVVDDADFGSSDEDWQAAAEAAAEWVERPRLLTLCAPARGAALLRYRDYRGLVLPDAAALLAAWTERYGATRGRLTEEQAANALLFWMTPAAGLEADGTVDLLARERFTARAVRYMALRLGASSPGRVVL